jgi:hypothetical protein
VRTAKELFQASTGFSDFKVFRASVGYETACQAALLQFVESLPETTADPTCAMHGLQIMGARRVLDILSRLHEPDTESKPEPPAWQYKKRTADA